VSSTSWLAPNDIAGNAGPTTLEDYQHNIMAMIELARANDIALVLAANLLTAMRAAGRPVGAHLFQEGGHAFASGYPNSPTSSWIVVLDAWLARLGAGS
jgi:hypothetical protein